MFYWVLNIPLQYTVGKYLFNVNNEEAGTTLIDVVLVSLSSTLNRYLPKVVAMISCR